MTFDSNICNMDICSMGTSKDSQSLLQLNINPDLDLKCTGETFFKNHCRKSLI